MSLPESMFAWRYAATSPSLQDNLVFESKVPLPPYSPVPANASSSKHNTLVRVLRASLNPVDYKLPELPLAGRLIGLPATPGIDFVGRVVATTRPDAAYAPGDLVVGKKPGPARHGTLAEFVVAGPGDVCVKVQEAALGDGQAREDKLDALAGLGVAGSTELQSLRLLKKPADGRQVRVLINGASGGTGVWGVQIAKAYGYHVTAVASTANIEVCRSIGADQIIDYKATSDMPATLAALAHPKSNGPAPAGLVGDAPPSTGDFDLIIDNVGDPALYLRSADYLVRDGTYVVVGMGLGAAAIMGMTRMMLNNAIGRAASLVGMGGGYRKMELVVTKNVEGDVAELASLVVDGKVKNVGRSFRLADAKAAYEALRGLDGKKGSGKVIVKIAED